MLVVGEDELELAAELDAAVEAAEEELVEDDTVVAHEDADAVVDVGLA